MAYQQTTATSVEDLINKLATFAAGLGWTVERNTLSTTNRTLSLKRATTDYLHVFNTDTTNVRLRASTGIDTGVAVSSQPGVSSAEAIANGGAGPFSDVWFMGNNSPAPYIHCIYSLGSGRFRHFTLGLLEKIGAYTGGTYFDAMWVSTSSNYNNSPPSTYNHVMFGSEDQNASVEGGVRVDFDGLTNNFAWISSVNSSANPVVLIGVERDTTGAPALEAYTTGFYSASINSWSGVTPLKPLKARIERSGGFWSYIGVVPGIRMVNMSRWAPGDEFSIGPDTWKVFPWWRQGNRATGDTTGEYSQQNAYAYLKTV